MGACVICVTSDHQKRTAIKLSSMLASNTHTFSSEVKCKHSQSHTHVRTQHAVRNHSLGHHARSPRMQCVQLRMFLVGVDRAGKRIAGLPRIMFRNPLAGGPCRLSTQILSRGISGGEVESHLTEGGKKRCKAGLPVVEKSALSGSHSRFVYQYRWSSLEEPIKKLKNR